jgi:hypothetical protein
MDAFPAQTQCILGLISQSDTEKDEQTRTDSSDFFPLYGHSGSSHSLQNGSH